MSVDAVTGEVALLEESTLADEARKVGLVEKEEEVEAETAE